MDFPRFSSKIDPKHPDHATVTVPFTPDTGDQAKSNGQATVKAAAAGDKAGNDAMVSEGGHASPGKAPDEVREPDASATVKNEPSKGSADGVADKPALSAQSER